MDIPAAITVVTQAFRDVFAWATGGRSKSQNSIRQQAETAHDDFTKAHSKQDAAGANAALSTARRVRDKAKSDRP